MKTLKEIISSINFDDKRIQTSPDWEKLASHFGIYDLCWSNDTRLKGYHVKTWLCTDTWVGWVAYFLEDEWKGPQFVCLSTQSARKSDIEFEFASNEAHSKVRDYLFSLTTNEDFKVVLLDLDLEVSDRYSVSYNSQILHKSAWLNDEKVKVTKNNYSYNDDKEKYFHTVEVTHDNGLIEEVDCSDLEFEYNNLD